MSDQEIRTSVIMELTDALARVRLIVSRMNDSEREYATKHLPTYRQLVESIRRHDNRIAN